MTDSALANVKRLIPERQNLERCELCSEPIQEEHRHLLDPSTRELLCSCQACALLFERKQAARYRLVPRRVALLNDFMMSDELWEDLSLPVNMVFIHYSTPAQRVVAYYPSPAGATESLVSLEGWQELVQQNPQLEDMQPDVEALLINRIGLEPHEWQYYVVPIDKCYQLVGIVRSGWRGLSGGTEVWKEIKAFFEGLRQRAA